MREFDPRDLQKEVKPVAKKTAPPKVTQKMAEGLVGTVQMVLTLLPWTREDALDQVEQQVLARDIVAYAKQNAYFARAVVWLVSQTANTGIILDVGAIATVRLANHGLVPMEAGLGAKVALALSAGSEELLTGEGGIFAGLMGGQQASSPPQNLEDLPVDQAYAKLGLDTD